MTSMTAKPFFSMRFLMNCSACFGFAMVVPCDVARTGSLGELADVEKRIDGTVGRGGRHASTVVGEPDLGHAVYVVVHHEAIMPMFSGTHG